MSSWFTPVWERLTADFEVAPDFAALCIGEVEKAYSGKKRHYHNQTHILELLQYAKLYADRLKMPQLVDFAIVYHDIVYNVLRKDNEQKSAALAVKRLAAIGMGNYETGLVKLYIEATQTHQVPAGLEHASDLLYFLDFDMAILGTPWETYENYTKQVRKEYSIYPDLLYKPGRTAFLNKCLAAPAIFHTAVFRELYDASARSNMQKELQYLCAK